MALIDLKNPPEWFTDQAEEFLSVSEATLLTGSSGSIKLLTNPVTAGYVQNPISVYFCYSEAGALEVCIAEVTNTPWGARVTFLFDPRGESVPKALHVSPFMDMKNTWKLKAELPGEQLSLSVSASHPEHGEYFLASLKMRLSDKPSCRSEEAGFFKLLRYGFQPQRDALLIYWQAVKLLWKGAPFFGPPDPSFKSRVSREANNPPLATGGRFLWTPAKSFPWNLDQ